MDTGSTDGTPELLASRYGIPVLFGALDGDNCNSKAPARNQAHAALKAQWILSLDADERIARRDLEALIAMPDNCPPSRAISFPGIRSAGTSVVEDYKLCLYRHGLAQHRLRARERAGRPAGTQRWMPPGSASVWCVTCPIRRKMRGSWRSTPRG